MTFAEEDQAFPENGSSAVFDLHVVEVMGHILNQNYCEAGPMRTLLPRWSASIRFWPESLGNLPTGV